MCLLLGGVSQDPSEERMRSMVGRLAGSTSRKRPYDTLASSFSPFLDYLPAILLSLHARVRSAGYIFTACSLHTLVPLFWGCNACTALP